MRKDCRGVSLVENGAVMDTTALRHILRPECKYAEGDYQKVPGSALGGFVSVTP